MTTSQAQILREYGESLGIDLDFQHFDEELRTLPGQYEAPQGTLLLALVDGQVAACGGFRPMPIMEDVDIVRRLGWRRLTMLSSRAVTSASRYRQDGYGRRIARNLSCLALYALRVPPDTIARLYR